MQGTARIIGRGFDTDAVMRYIDFEFDPPLQGDEIRRVKFGAIDTDMLPVAMNEKRELEAAARFCNRSGYQLIIPDDFFIEED